MSVNHQELPWTPENWKEMITEVVRLRNIVATREPVSRPAPECVVATEEVKKGVEYVQKGAYAMPLLDDPTHEFAHLEARDVELLAQKMMADSGAQDQAFRDRLMVVLNKRFILGNIWWRDNIIFMAHSGQLRDSEKARLLERVQAREHPNASTRGRGRGRGFRGGQGRGSEESSDAPAWRGSAGSKKPGGSTTFRGRRRTGSMMSTGGNNPNF